MCHYDLSHHVCRELLYQILKISIVVKCIDIVCKDFMTEHVLLLYKIENKILHNHVFVYNLNSLVSPCFCIYTGLGIYDPAFHAHIYPDL